MQSTALRGTALLTYYRLARPGGYAATRTTVEIIGLNETSATLLDKFAVHDKPDAVERLMGQ